MNYYLYQLLISLIALLVSSQATFAQDSNVNSDWKFSGNFQLRTELDARDFTNSTPGILFSSLRTRLSVSKSVFSSLDFFVQIQDSRVFGEEENTLAPLANLDIHQAFVVIKNPLDIPVDVKAGRFEVNYGTERFIGPVGWHFVGRSFDGTMLTFDPGFQLDLFGLTLANRSAYIGNANPSLYQGIDYNEGFWMFGTWAQIPIDDNKLDLFTYLEDNTNKSNGEDDDIFRFTSGFSYWLKSNLVDAIVEAAYQYGSLNVPGPENSFINKDLGAYLVSINLIKKFGNYKGILGADLLQGTPVDQLDKISTFNPAYGTNHKFYGFMDYFINLPANTANLGLNDYYATLGYAQDGSKFDISGTYHLMGSNVESANGDNLYGHEFDCLLGYQFIKGTKITLGVSAFLPDQLMIQKFKEANRPHEDVSFWSFLMISTNL